MPALVFFHGDGSIKYLNTQEINHPMLLNYARVAFGHEGLSICMIRNAFPLLEKNCVSVLPFVFEIYLISIMFFIFSMRGHNFKPVYENKETGRRKFLSAGEMKRVSLPTLS